jgi:hypothetical protein
MKLDGIRAMRGERAGPTQPRNLVTWAMLVLHFLLSEILFREKLAPAKFQVI